MRTPLIFSCLYLLLFAMPPPAGAAVLFADDFQDGDHAAWSMSGVGDEADNYYLGNWSLRLDGLRQATVTVSTQGYRDVSLSMDVAALYLVYGDYCFAEYSVDGGVSWQTLVQVGYNGASGAMHTGTVADGLDDKPGLRLRFRAYTLYGNYCYADNVVLSGTPVTGGTSPDIAVAGSGNFGSVTAGTAATRELAITNQGNAALQVGTLSGLAPPFALVADGCSDQALAPGATCAVRVQFAPDSSGVYDDALHVPSNDPDEPDKTIVVEGAAEEPVAMYDPLEGNGNVNRSRLTYASLTGNGAPGLIDFSHYAVPVGAANPVNVFEGRLLLSGQATHGHVQEVGGDNNLQYYPDAAHLPPFDFAFVQDGTHIIPVTRGRVPGSPWDLVLEPGRVWHEAGDHGFSRVALPFSLQEPNQDCIWNGVMMFLFRDDGSVTDVAYQIASGTCRYLKLDFWGRLEASYVPGAVTGAASIRADYEAEVAGRMPVKPLAALASDYPGGVIVDNIGSDVTAGNMTVYGVAYNGVHYLGGCQTRHGTYPYCDVLTLPSYSTAKSIVGGFGLMRLEQKYPAARNALLSDWVSACDGTQWTGVTFEHALDMATGNYSSDGFEVDEASAAMYNGFFLQNTNAQKVGFACSYPRKWAPGALFVYHTSDTYLLGRGMQMFYRARAGSGADFYHDVLVDEVFRPLGLSPTINTTRRTRDAASQPYSGYGLIYHSDDIVKLARFLNADQGMIDGVQVLDSAMVQATLNLGSGGLEAGGPATRYNNGFWYYDLDQALYHDFGCSASTWVPYMSGYGGISVVLFPNGMVYYNYSDNGDLYWSSTAAELDKIAPMCP